MRQMIMSCLCLVLLSAFFPPESQASAVDLDKWLGTYTRSSSDGPELLGIQSVSLRKDAASNYKLEAVTASLPSGVSWGEVPAEIYVSLGSSPRFIGNYSIGTTKIQLIVSPYQDNVIFCSAFMLYDDKSAKHVDQLLMKPNAPPAKSDQNQLER